MGSREGKIYAYNLLTKQWDQGNDFDTLNSAGNGTPRGIWSDGTTMWVSDWEDHKIYAYNLSTKQRDLGKDFDIPIAAGSDDLEGIWSDRTTMWVADDNSAKIYAYNMLTKQPDQGKDFDTLRAAGNYRPQGIWSDGTTMWIAPRFGGKIYAYNLSTKQRDQEKDFDTLRDAGNQSPQGIWSDGTTMWVSDLDDSKIYAYNMPPGSGRPPVGPPPVTGPAVTPEPDDPDPPPPEAVSIEKCVSEVGADEVGDIELGDRISGTWSGGCPSISRGGRLAKYYTFNLPITTAVEIALDSHLDTYLVLRSGGLSGDIAARDDDSGPVLNSLIAETLTAGEYTIEATTFHSEIVDAEFTLSVTVVPRVLYGGPVSDVAHADYAPDGPTLTVKLLPTLPRGTLEITIEDADGFGAGTGPLGGAQTAEGSSGTVIVALPETVWVYYGQMTVEVKQSGSWSTHTRADEQTLLAEGGTGPDLRSVLTDLIQILGNAEGALQLIEYVTSLVKSASILTASHDEVALDAIFEESYANCVSQVTVSWIVPATNATGVRVSMPLAQKDSNYLSLTDDDYVSLAASFVANGDEAALAQLHDLLATGLDTPSCEGP